MKLFIVIFLLILSTQGLLAQKIRLSQIEPIEGRVILSTGVAAKKVLMADGLNTASWQSVAWDDLINKPFIPEESPFSLTTTGFNAASSYNPATGVLNIPQPLLGMLPNNTAATLTDYIPWFDVESSSDLKMTIATLASLIGGAGGGGDVYKSGTPANSQIALWSNGNTIYGSSNFAYNGYDFTLRQSGSYTPLMKYIDDDYPTVNYYQYFENSVFRMKIYNGSTTYTPLTLKTTGISTTSITLENTGTYEDVNGAIRYNGTDLLGKVGGTWKSLTAEGGGSMVYPTAGIPISTGSAWGTSIANNSANWNAAHSWGNHAGLYRPISYTPSWGTIGGTLTDQTDLQNALNAKQNTLTRTSMEAIIPIIPYSAATTLNTAVSGNMKRSVSTATTITLSNLTEGRTGNIEITYTGAAVVTFNVGSANTLRIAANIYNTTTNAYTKSVKTQSTGTAVYSYYMSGTNVYFTGTQIWN